MAELQELKLRLFESCRDGNYDVASALLSSGVSVHSEDEDGRTPLFVSSMRGHEEIVSLALERGASVNTCDKYGKLALVKACQTGNVRIIELLIVHGAKGLAPALKVACWLGHLNIVACLISHGADVNERNQQAETPLMKACANGHLDIAELLIERGALVESSSGCLETALVDACRNNHVMVLKLLMKHGANVNVSDMCGRTAFMTACGKGYFDIVKLLMKRNVDVDISDNSGKTALIRACENGHLDIVKLLINHGVDMNVSDEEGETALMKACKNGHTDVVDLLIKHHREMTARDADGDENDPCSLRKRLAGIAGRIFLKRNVDILNYIIRDKKGETLLMRASWYGHVGVVKLLIDSGADVNLPGTDGSTALSRACHNGFIRVAELLIEHGACLNVRGQNGFTALMEAAENGHIHVMELLIRLGGNVNLTDTHGFTAFMRVCQRGYHKVVEFLIDQGVDVNSSSNGRITPLMMACQSKRNCNKMNHGKVVELLLQHGANPDTQDKEFKRTAAMMAAMEDNVECLDKLLPGCPNLDLKDADGKTVFSYAMKNRETACLKVLLADNVLLSGGILKRVHRDANISYYSLDHILVTIEAGVFEWVWCRQRHFRPVSLAALNAGLCPGNVEYTNNSTSNSDSTLVSPLIRAFLVNDTMLIDTFLRHLYYFPEDYRALITDSDIKGRTAKVAMLDGITLQPMSLVTWSFLTISKSISLAGPVGLRSQRVDSLPIPDSLKRKLKFR